MSPAPGPSSTAVRDRLLGTGEANAGPASAGTTGRGAAGASAGLVLTRRGRLAITASVVLTAIALVLAVQAWSGGPAPADPAVGNDSAGATSLDSPLIDEPPAGSTGQLDAGELAAALLAPEARVPTSEVTEVPAKPDPIVVNGRPQPDVVAVPAAASGDLAVVAGSTEPVTGGRVWTYRVEVEKGLPFDGADFAAAVHATLADPRGWAQDGNVFQRVDSDDVDFRLLLASPALTDQLCAPLQTRGRVSCRNGDLVVLNALRWADGIEDYAGDVASYREYVVNHEVGHRLGRGHTQCPAAGEPAPVMMQQTYGLEGCAPNSWPLPGE